MIYRSAPSLPYFSAVVKNVASPNIEIKKLVYIYILHHAESEPDLALLSINAIQKTLSDHNPQVRAIALRVMSGIRVPVISQIVSLAIKKGCMDMSPHVRKAAALAIPKCYKLDPSTLPQLLESLTILLGDKQYFVAGSAVAAFLEICPRNLDLIHKHYRVLVRKLIDMDEWGQLALIKLMTIYARKCFPRCRKNQKGKAKEKSHEEKSTEQAEDPETDAIELDPDLELFLQSCRTLLSSRNAAVVIAVTRALLHLGTPDYVESTAGPLVALLRSPHDLHEVVFYNIVGVCLIRPTPFLPFLSHFLIRASDSTQTLRLKLELLTLMFPHSDENTRGLVLSELEHFTNSDNEELVRESVRAIGRCAQNDLTTSKRCLNLLLKQAASSDDLLVAEALTVVRHLIQQDPAAHQKTIIRLAKNLDTMINPEARANIIWLVGEFSASEEQHDVAPDVLRILLQTFADEGGAAKLQIVLLAAKVYLHHLNRTTAASSQDARNGISEEQRDEDPKTDDADVDEQSQTQPGPEHIITKLWQYTLQLVRYDTSYDLRDRTRLFTALLDDPSSTQLANLMLLAPKPAPHIPSPSEGRQNLLLGSTSYVLGSESGPTGLHGYEPLPHWVIEGEEPDPALRDVEEQRNTYTSKPRSAGDSLNNASKQSEGEVRPASSSAYKAKTLDDWLAEENVEESGNEEGDEEDEDDEEIEEEEEESEYETETDEEGDEDDVEGGSERRILLK